MLISDRNRKLRVPSSARERKMSSNAYKIFSADCKIGHEPDYVTLVPIICETIEQTSECCRAAERHGFIIWKVETPDGRILTRELIQEAIECGDGALESALAIAVAA